MKVLLTLILVFVSVPVMAQGVPVPESKKEAIGEYNKQLEAQKSEKEALEKKAQSIGKDLKATKNELVGVAKSIQKNEADLQSLEQNLVELEEERAELQSELKEDRASIAQLIIALERIRRVPPEAMIARPDAPIETARSAMLMQDILPALNTQSEALKKKLSKLSTIETELQIKRDTVLERSEQLKVAQTDLNSLMKKREDLYASVNTDLKERQKEIKRISRQAKNLSDLVEKLEKEREKARQLAEKEKKASVRQASLTPLPSIGDSRMPLRGIIRTAYGEPDSFGAKSKGISIEGRSGALIVAPMGGVIRFAGYFKNYGNMIILEHKNGYHSLIAGLEKIDTVVDQSVSAGEPIGALYNASSGKAPTLYFELRHDGQAINPANKLNLG